MKDGYKLCNGCGQEKEFRHFAKVKPGRGDRNGLASRCYVCKQAYIDKSKGNEGAVHKPRVPYPRTQHGGLSYAQRRYRASSVVRNKVVDSQRANRAKRFGVEPGRYTTEDIKQLYGNSCHICQLPIAEGEFSIDHVIPMSKGGSDSVENIRPAHLKCNRVKRDHLPSHPTNVGVDIE